MTIDSATTPMRVRYVSSTDQTTFTVPFPVYDATDLTVYVDGVLQTYDVTPANATEYSISAFEAASTDIVFGGTGQTVGADVLILNDIPVERNSDFSATGVFPIGAMNLQLDKITAMIREREEETELRVLRLAITDFPEALNDLPVKATRAGYLLGFDTDGQPDTTYSATGLVASATSAALTALSSEIDAASAAAAASASAALASELAAAASETAAAASETAAGLSETAAAASETAAGVSETNAAASETAAGLSETAAGASETAAGLSASNAATSETNAATSASNASTSETNAGTSETNAANSAAAASTSAGNASTAQTAAEAAQAAAELAFDNFDDLYLGAKAADPTLDNDGDPLATGALYFNTVDNRMNAYDGAAWVDAAVILAAQAAAEAAQTAAEAAQTAAELAETNAGTSETNAAASAAAAAADLLLTNADVVSTNADVIATAADVIAAAASASAASTSETNAAASEAAAAASFDAFDDIYLGAKASEPTLDNDGNALQDGALYFNTGTAKMNVYDLGGTAWSQIASGLTDIVQDLTPQLGGDLDAQGNNITEAGDVTFKTGAQGGTLRTGTSNADKFQIQAYDVDGAAYITVMEADAGNDPIMQLFTDYFHFENSVDPTKIMDMDLTGATTGTTMTLAFPQTANRTVTFPNATGTLALTSDLPVSTVDFDPVGTDNSTAVTFAGTGTYISLAGQQITVDPITVSDISDIAANYQPLDADLTSWAGVTRAAGFDTFAATPSTANFLSLVTDETFVMDADIGSTVQAYDVDTLKADTADNLTAAFTATVTDDGTKSSGTYTPTPASGGQYKKCVHGAGAFTLAPYSPASNVATTLSLLIVNASASGVITTSGFTIVTGDAFDNTGTNKFLCRIEVVDYGGTEVSSLDVVALQ